MYLYKQGTGELSSYNHLAGGLRLLARCYSGAPEAKNDPLRQHEKAVGPIPVGAYMIGDPSESLDHGPVALHLVPEGVNQMFGRGDFLLHGDSIEHPGTASHGCIIAPRPVREAIRDGKDRQLLVIP